MDILYFVLFLHVSRHIFGGGRWEPSRLHYLCPFGIRSAYETYHTVTNCHHGLLLEVYV